MADITVIGAFVMDTVANVEEFPREGQTVLGGKLRVYPGGKGANQAVAAARLGGDTEMIGCLGEDGNGEVFMNILKSEGIACSHVKFSKSEPTGVAQIQINEKSENKIVVIPSANHEFKGADIEALEETLKKTKLVVLQLEMPSEVTAIAVDLCHRHGVPVLLNPAPAVPLSERFLEKITYLTPNETELEILTGISTDTEENLFRAADRLLDFGVRYVIATLGRRGAMLASREEKKIIPGYPVQAVDTVAAGDSFNGALAKCIAAGERLESAVRFANAVGALTVTKHGAIPSLPTLRETEEFLKNRS